VFPQNVRLGITEWGRDETCQLHVQPEHHPEKAEGAED
jgi:hypothetical protein